ncbi:dehydrogenase [Vulcanococcus limneticus]|uniref:dehydrogenase n=1 Tax=Vulcanococcus limneticus TaxID=2170428 RepID=UPI00398BE3D2
MSALQPRPTERRPPVPQLATALLSLAALVLPLPGAVEAQTLSSLGGSAAAPAVDPLLGPRSPLPKDWVGTRGVSPAIPILMLAGHADAQGIGGSGTSGEAVGLYGAAPMRPGISDEHYWCLQVAHAVAVLGRQRGLNINFHIPPVRTMLNGDESGTNWSVGREHAAAGGYALEIHFDAYGSAGVGSGLIPPLHRQFSTIDESLAQEFGSFPMNFRDQLGGPKRGIGLLEVGKLEGPLEASLRDPRTRKRTIQYIAQRVVYAIQRGIATPGSGTTTGLLPALPPPQPPVVAGP